MIVGSGNKKLERLSLSEANFVVRPVECTKQHTWSDNKKCDFELNHSLKDVYLNKRFDSEVICKYRSMKRFVWALVFPKLVITMIVGWKFPRFCDSVGLLMIFSVKFSYIAWSKSPWCRIVVLHFSLIVFWMLCIGSVTRLGN